MITPNAKPSSSSNEFQVIKVPPTSTVTSGDLSQVTTPLSNASMNRDSNMSNLMNNILNSKKNVVLKAFDSLPGDTMTGLIFQKDKNPMKIYGDDMLAFIELLEKNQASWLNTEPYVIQIFFYKCRHNLKANIDEANKTIRQSMGPWKEDIVFYQIHTGCVVKNDQKEMFLFDYDKVEEILGHDDFQGPKAFHFNKIGHFFTNEKTARFPRIDNIITYELQQHKISKDLYQQKLISIIVGNGLNSADFRDARNDILTLRNQLLDYVDSIAKKPVTRIEIVETFFNFDELAVSKFPRVWSTKSRDHRIKYSTCILQLLHRLHSKGAFVKVTEWKEYCHSKTKEAVDLLSTDFERGKTIPTRQEIDRCYKTIDIFLAFVDGIIDRKASQRADVFYLNALKKKGDSFVQEYKDLTPNLIDEFTREKERYKCAKFAGVSFGGYFELIYRSCPQTTPIADELYWSGSKPHVTGKTDHETVLGSISAPKHALMALIKDHVFGNATMTVEYLVGLRAWIQTNVVYWPAIFLDGKADAKNYAVVETLRDSNRSTATNVPKKHQNLVQNQAKKPQLDEDLERIVDLYRPHEVSVKRPPPPAPASDSDVKLREQEMLLKKLELLMRFHKRGRENWPQEVRDTYDRVNVIDLALLHRFFRHKSPWSNHRAKRP
uniref:Uncharacterized protein n=1 Tax=Trichogramma kaykai TaxID=54128 RepID=A0ABD2W6C9_9HYME